MATTGAGSEAKNNPHGMDKQIWANIAKKFDPVRAVAAVNWVGEVCQEEMPAQGNETVADWFAEIFKDSYYLTKLTLTLEPTVKKSEKKFKKWKAKHHKMAFSARNDIEIFAHACKWMGMRQTDIVTSQDVFEKENPNAVLCCLYALCACAQKRGWNGPVISGGFKHSTEVKREFSAETLAKGANVVPKWMEGSIAVDKGNKLDGAGIVKTAGSEDHKADYSTLGTWQSGAIHHESEPGVDKIVRTQANKDWKISNEVPLFAKGTIAHNDNDGIDGYGVVMQPNLNRGTN